MDIENIINDNKYIEINKTLLLKQKEINLLELYHISYQNLNNLKDLIYILDNYIEDSELDNDELEELDNLLSELQERDYYLNTNK